MTEINWFDVLTEERRWGLIKDAIIELKVLTRGPHTTWEERDTIILGEYEGDKLVLLPNGLLRYETSDNKRVGFPIIYPGEYPETFEREIVEKFQLTADQIRAVRRSIEEKSPKK